MALSKNAAEQVRLTVTTGAAANSDITVTGIRTRDCVILSIQASDATGYTASNFSITAANKIQGSGTTAGKTLHILWADLSQG